MPNEAFENLALVRGQKIPQPIKGLCNVSHYFPPPKFSFI
jgi:hypothetical protein